MGGVFCMELPKNITQIGEADKHCRVYVEDYVVSYIKQMNGMAQNKDIAIALYGRRTTENGVAYLFAYGSAKLNFLQKPVRHLSQAQEQEIEKLRKKYFPEMTFLGYQILNGEMVEGFRICEQEICRYEVVKKRQEERRQRQESGHAGRVEYTGRAEHRDNIIPMPTEGLRRMKMAATGVFVLLCVMALALMRQENTGESLEETARQAMSSLMEQKLPDAAEEQNQVSTLVAEDKLEAALRQENNAMAENATATAETTVPETMEAEAAVEDTTEVAEEPQPEVTPTPEPTPEVTVESETPQTQAAVAQPTAYTIKKGDTLIGISLRNYGSNTKVSEICALNGITDPDDIKIGQEILLP